MSCITCLGTRFAALCLVRTCRAQWCVCEVCDAPDWHCNPAWMRMTSSCSAHHDPDCMFHRPLRHASIPNPPLLAASACMRPHCVLKDSMQSILLQVRGQQRSDHAHCALQAPGPAATATSASWTSMALRASSSTALSSCASTWPTSACSSSSTSTSSRASRSVPAKIYIA